MKTKKTKQQPLKFNWSAQRLAISGFILIVAVLIISQLYIDIVVWHRAVSPGNQVGITNLIINSVNDSKEPAVIDPRTGDNYFPAAHLKLPGSTNPGHLTYSYQKAANGFSEELQVTSSLVVHRAEDKLWIAQNDTSMLGPDPTAVFNEVPHLQACSRGVHIFFAPPTKSSNDGLTSQGTLAMDDGRKLYIYTEPNCSADLDPIVGYLKQLQSF